ncbi:tripartite tricarboxylate transporter TctB family protein [Inquilinus limosus]|uniref:tripartite tricarboxylate transporter TctB family protein n=1 Tax=Inquilinus limosus TaxID=171674 RepID=UPI00047AAD5E|nr:tripartite tricarboxylate transporter TctB family protein [Inquilinus limosus]
MPGRINWPDLLFGLFLCVVAAIVLVATRKLSFGNPTEMGPGFMPRVLAIGAAGFGLVFALRSLAIGGEGIETPKLRPILGILAAVAVFALLTVKAGLAVAAFATVIVAGLASRETRLGETAIFAVALSAGAVILFVLLLDLPVPVWPRF